MFDTCASTLPFIHRRNTSQRIERGRERQKEKEKEQTLNSYLGRGKRKERADKVRARESDLFYLGGEKHQSLIIVSSQVHQWDIDPSDSYLNRCYFKGWKYIKKDGSICCVGKSTFEILHAAGFS